MLLVLFLFLLYLFLICPRIPRRNIDHLRSFDYAHRGLWDKDKPENSIPAFLAAVHAGYGIELDVQLTKDHQPVVIHDQDLVRSCGLHADIHQFTLKEAQNLPLSGSNASIPSLEDALRIIDGQVPVIVEIKNCRDIHSLCASTAALLDQYHGPFCIESFNPIAVMWFRMHRPSWIRGQLAFSLHGRKYPKKLSYLLLSTLIQNVLGRPDFLAFDVATDQSFPFFLVQHLFHPWTVGWTIQTDETWKRCREKYDLIIFEAIRPEK